MKVAAITWDVEADDIVTANREEFESKREFVDAEHNEFIWSSFARGLNDDWDEDGILKIPEWLAKDNGFPYASEDRMGNTDWSGYAAVNLDTDRETDKALFVEHLRCSDTSVLSGTNGLRSRNQNEYLPKSQVTLYTLEEPPATRRECWNCGVPMFYIQDGVLDKATVYFEYDDGRYSEYLCADCATGLATSEDSTKNLEECHECGTLDVTCRPYLVVDEDDSGWRCEAHRPEKVENAREEMRRADA